VELRDARLVDADLRTDVLHGDLAEVVEADHLALTGRKGGNRGTHAAAHLGLLVQTLG